MLLRAVIRDEWIHVYVSCHVMIAMRIRNITVIEFPY